MELERVRVRKGGADEGYSFTVRFMGLPVDLINNTACFRRSLEDTRHFVSLSPTMIILIP